MKEEVRRGVRRLKGRKVAGMCGIVPEMLEAEGEVVVQWLTEFFNMVWRAGVAPWDWKLSRLGQVVYRSISLAGFLN